MNALLSASLIFVSFATSASAVGVKFDLKLDSRPQETAFEVRGPLPSTVVVDEASYLSLDGESIERQYNLEEGRFYYLMLLDSGRDGITDGSFKLTASYKTADVTLKEGTGDFGHGKTWNFMVPVTPAVESKKSGGIFMRR